MKLILAVLAINFCFGSIEAGPNRRTEQTAFGGSCPSGGDCEEFVKGLVKGTCADYGVHDGQYGVVTCDTVECSGEGWKKIGEDLIKPYPNCCSRCERA